MSSKPGHLRLIVLCGLLSLSACSTVQWPAYEAPKLDLPPPPLSQKPPLKIDRQWWKSFEDPDLNHLIDETLANNLDLAKAAAAVEEARANVKGANALLSPRVDAGGRISATQRQLTIGSQDINDINYTTAAGVAVNWEWDLWGRIRQMNDAALATLSASEHTRNAVELSISSVITEAYFQLLAFETKLHLTQDAQRSLKEITDLEFRRWKAQVGTELAYRQSIAELSSTEALIPVLEYAIAQTELAIKALAGRTPRLMSAPLPKAEKLPSLPDMPREFDSNLLLRRPDIASAEQLLVAAHADINAIQAERYPRMTLSILAGALATTSKAISGVPLYWDITGGLTAPIYDAGLIDAKVEGAQARRNKAEAHYRYAVSVAFRETYEAMVGRDLSDKQLAAFENELEMRRKAVALTEKSYDAGRSSKFEVLTEILKFYQTRLQVVDARLNQYVSRARFYKALGGGILMLFHVYSDPVPEDYYDPKTEPFGIYRQILDADWLLYILLPMLAAIIIALLMLAWRIHEIPAHKADHKKMRQVELVSALTLLGLLEHWVWAVALFIAYMDWQATEDWLVNILRRSKTHEVAPVAVAPAPTSAPPAPPASPMPAMPIEPTLTIAPTTPPAEEHKA